MSVTGHGAKTGHVRHADDWYSTPAWATRAILGALDLPTSFCDTDTILDPCCGDGAILRVVAEVMPKVRRLGIEIDEGRATAAGAVCADALGPTSWGPTSAVVLTNPPFNLAMPFVHRSLAETSGPVVMLLRLAWLASQKRAPFMRANTPSVYVLPKRPSFTGKGTDSADYAWFVWRDPSGSARVRILDVA